MRRNIALLLCTCFLISFSPLFSFSQTLQVTGKVTNKSGEALPGATIAVKGGNTSTISDAEGSFSITVPSSGSVLVVSYAGMTSIERVVTSGGVQNFELESSEGKLDEVVIIGYGTQKRETSPRLLQL